MPQANTNIPCFIHRFCQSGVLVSLIAFCFSGKYPFWLWEKQSLKMTPKLLAQTTFCSILANIRDVLWHLSKRGSETWKNVNNLPLLYKKGAHKNKACFTCRLRSLPVRPWSNLTRWPFQAPTRQTSDICLRRNGCPLSPLHHDSFPSWKWKTALYDQVSNAFLSLTCGPSREQWQRQTQSCGLHWWCNCIWTGTCLPPMQDLSHFYHQCSRLSSLSLVG